MRQAMHRAMPDAYAPRNAVSTSTNGRTDGLTQMVAEESNEVLLADARERKEIR